MPFQLVTVILITIKMLTEIVTLQVGRIEVRIPSRGKKYFSSPKCPSWFLGLPNLLWVPELFPRDKVTRASRWPLTKICCRNSEWMELSSTPICLHSMYMDNFTFTFTKCGVAVSHNSVQLITLIEIFISNTRSNGLTPKKYFALKIFYGMRGDVVVKALRYKPGGRGFDSRWCHWNFSVT